MKMIRSAGRFTGPRYSAIPNRHARRGGMASPSPAPLALICGHRRMLTGTHEDVTSALVHDGEYCVTASLDGELRVWSEHSGAVRAAFAETTQRVRAHDAGVTALARVADGYIISGGADGELAVWTRLPDAPPLHPSHLPPPPDPPSASDGDHPEQAPDAPDAPEPEPEPERAEPTADPDEDGITPEERELRLAAKLKWAREEEYRGPYASPVAACRFPACVDAPARVVAILPLHQRPHDDAGAVDADTPVDVDVSPSRVAVALAPRAGSLVHRVRILDVERAFAFEQDLDHPEGVTCALRRLCADGKDRIVTGCLDGRVRVWAADPPPWVPPWEPPKVGEGEPEPTPPPPPPPNLFRLEAALEGHNGRAVTALAWLDDHPAFPAPWKPPPANATGVAEEGADADAEQPEYWPGKDASLFFLSGGADGGVRMWCRDRADDDQEGAEMGAGTGAADSSVGAAGADARAAPRFEWRAERHQPIVSDAPAAPRVARERPRGEPLGAILREAAVKSLAAFDGKVVTGLVDGRMAVWGHRVWDASGEAGWVLEKVHPPSGGRRSAVLGMAACGHNLVVAAADGSTHLWA